ncbi:MAG TPA: hybrid sensor histidine kinase/response regulator, partial [Blastocatellia bacterium]|nr:hybrid sensor histidine kinase/response regulator [Blastocatellia bacterium]
LRALERERNRTRLPAIALTAYARLDDRLRALSSGYLSHISKPVEMTELLAVMASLIGRGGRSAS